MAMFVRINYTEYHYISPHFASQPPSHGPFTLKPLIAIGPEPDPEPTILHFALSL